MILLESRVAAASIAPTVLEQYFLERLNDALADLNAQRPDHPGLRPLAFNARAQETAIKFDTLPTGKRIKAVLRQSVPISERHSFVGYSGTLRINENPEQFEVDGQTFHVAPYGQIDTVAQRLATYLRDTGDEKVVYSQHRDVAVSLQTIKISNQLYARYAYVGFKAADPRSTVSGTVIRDLDGDGRYDIGEGVGGVKISVSGQGATRTFDSGGYTLSLNKPGKVVVTASGGSLASPLRQTVVVPKDRNVRITFVTV